MIIKESMDTHLTIVAFFFFFTKAGVNHIMVHNMDSTEIRTVRLFGNSNSCTRVVVYCVLVLSLVFLLLFSMTIVGMC